MFSLIRIMKVLFYCLCIFFLSTFQFASQHLASLHAFSSYSFIELIYLFRSTKMNAMITVIHVQCLCGFCKTFLDSERRRQRVSRQETRNKYKQFFLGYQRRKDMQKCFGWNRIVWCDDNKMLFTSNTKPFFGKNT